MCVGAWATAAPSGKPKKKGAAKLALRETVQFPGVGELMPGKAQVEDALPQAVTLSNALFSARFEQTASGGLIFGGMKSSQGETLLKEGTELFTLKLADGTELKASTMKTRSVNVVALKGDSKAVTVSERLPGYVVWADFYTSDGSLQVTWHAVLRDGSHYLRQELKVKASKDVKFSMLTPMQYLFAAGGEPKISGNTTHGCLVVNKKMFAGLETPMSRMAVGAAGANSADEWNPEAWKPSSFQDVFENDVPSEFVKQYGAWCREMDGPVVKYVKLATGTVNFAAAGNCEVTFNYASGNHKLNLIGVRLCSTDGGKVISQDVHSGSTGDYNRENIYRLQVPASGDYVLQYWAETKTETITSSGKVQISLPRAAAEQGGKASGVSSRLVQGQWERKATLEKGQCWEVSSVVGLFASEERQQRRSFLAYSERERAVPYRPFVHYNDWYEVGIRLHDHDNPLERTTEKISLGIIQRWQQELYTKRKTYIDAFMIDDGWDEWNSLWDFHAGFPNGFAAVNRAAAKMHCGLGVWLGPVGGYGKSKAGRLASWNKAHPNRPIGNFELSDRVYFDAFVGRCRDMIRKYDMRYFKFDGISAKFHAKGPAALEDAEGIIRVISELRQVRPDVFINATVGTWASPFWFHYADSVWRQENDFGQVGNMGDARDKWISYRDRLVHEVFVQGAPFCPINSLMTHGTIITKNGPPRVMSTDPENCIKEMRAAFGCGSGLQEVYADADLLDQQRGRLWDELAACIAWIRRNEDVLPDVHWVGGNPWNGSDGDIYGWAAWNRKKCTLTLRNSSASPKKLRTTLRELFEVPQLLSGSIVLKSSYADQREQDGITNAEVDVDREIEFSLKPMEVLVLEGKNNLKKRQ